MDGSALFLGLIIGLLLGVILGYALSQYLSRRRIATLEAELNGRTVQIAETAAQLSEANAALAAAEAESRLLIGQSGADASVLRALSPVTEQLKSVHIHVQQLERDRAAQFGALAQQLKQAHDDDARLLATTRSLESALRSTSARGRWGEVQLHRVVESAGMLSHVDFTEQASFDTVEGRVRPDLVVNLPGGKHIFVDAKAPLSAYLAAQEADDDAARAALVEHAKAVKAHIDALNSKRYWDAEVNTPEFVICFIPAESILAAALHADAQLLDYALSKSVVLASPANLLATLKAVAFSWKQDVLTESAKDLFSNSALLYDRLKTLGTNVGKLGSSLKSSVDRYNAMVGSLESRVFPVARKLDAFDPESIVSPSVVEVQPRLITAPELIDPNEPKPSETALTEESVQN